MKRQITQVLTTGLLLGLLTQTAQASSFSDVSDSAWYSSYIQYVADRSFMSGTNQLFSPHNNSDRGTIAQALANLAGQGNRSATVEGYTDIADSPYASSIAWCLQQGIMSGYSDHYFAPNDSLTREAFAASLYKFAQLYGMDMEIGTGPLAGYGDVGAISSWAVTPMAWAVDKGLISGFEGSLNPQGTVTRTELAVMLTAYDHTQQGKTFDPGSYVSTSPSVPYEEEGSNTNTNTNTNTDNTATQSTDGAYKVVEIWATAETGDNIYQQANSSSTVLTALEPGARCQVYGYTSDGWLQVMHYGYWGYIPAESMSVSGDVEGNLPEVALGLQGYVANSVYLRQGPGEQYAVVETYTHPCFVYIYGKIGDWYQLEQGYLHSSAVELSLSAYRQKEAEAAIAFPEEVATGVELGQQIGDFALHFLGYPYRANASDLNGFDCAGFASYVYRSFGITIATTPVGIWAAGTPVDKADLQVGDLMIFGNIAHVGIYIGDQKIIHSANPSGAVIISSLTETYYANNHHSSRRYYE